jgi:hypothetical protein
MYTGRDSLAEFLAEIEVSSGMARLQASARCGLHGFTIKEKELLDRDGPASNAKPKADGPRYGAWADFGAPWSQDEKFATLAAWLALTVSRKRR